MKKLILLSAVLCSCFLQAQNKSVNIIKDFYSGEERSYKINESRDQIPNLELWLQNEFQLPVNFSLEEVKTINSLTAVHHHFQMKYKNVEIHDATIHLVEGNNGILREITYNLTPFTTSEENSSYPVSRANNLLDQFQADEVLNEINIWLPHNDALIAAKKVSIASHHTIHKDIIYTDQEVLYVIEKMKHHHASGPDDSLISGLVFDPDPLSSAQQNYLSPYVDNSDGPVTELNNERVTKQFVATYKNGVFSLVNDFVAIQELSSPVLMPITQTTNQFNYSRDQGAFEDVNAFYHLSNHKSHLDNLGFTNLPGYQILADVHALGGSDNSAFVTSITPFRLVFGEGGVDDAEDSDVIIHEFTHAYILAASGNNTGIVERECMEESLGDYFAASYSRTINNFNQQNVFSWDGHNEYWAGREVESTKDYKLVNFGGNIYEHTDLFASPLMEAYGIIGRNGMDKIVMESIFSMGTNSTFSIMAANMIDADYYLNGGVNFSTLKTAFVRRNILDANYVSNQEIAVYNSSLKVFGTYEFAQGGSLLIESLEDPIKNVKLIDISGRLTSSTSYDLGKFKSNISSGGLKSGIYILEIELKSGYKESFKVSKF